MNDRADDGSAESACNSSRRDFLTRAGLLAGGMALLGVPGLRPQPAAAAVKQGYVAGASALELDGQFIDFLKSAEGGFPKADVISIAGAPNQFPKKHIGPPRFQDIAIQCGPTLPKPLFDWITAMLSMVPLRKSGAIITADFNRVEQSRLQFNNASLTEFGIPACDGGSRDPGFFTLKFAPEITTPLAGKGGVLPTSLKAQQKAFLPSNFRLTIPGLDCTKVSKIEALTIKQSVAADPLGQRRDFKAQPGSVEFPNLVISVPESFAGTFYAWFQDMVIKGNSGEQNERAGTLEFLDPTLTSALFTVNLAHLGIFGFTPEKFEANSEGIKRVRIEMYCEQMTLAPGKV